MRKLPRAKLEAESGRPLNYVYTETSGQGHLMGITLGVLQNADGWWGEGDEMIFVDDETKPIIVGTGSEDYIWEVGTSAAAMVPCHSLTYNGARSWSAPERAGGRYCVYRWHGDNPVTFTRNT